MGLSELQAFQSVTALRNELQLCGDMFFDVTERPPNVKKDRNQKNSVSYLCHHCLAHFAFFKLNHILDASLQCSWNLIGSSYMILRSFLEQVVTTRRSE